MSKLRLNGTSSGYVEIAAPATGANNTITLPSTTGSIVVQGASGITSFTSGPVFVGSGTSTGTASQTLQVTGGAYVSGSLGIGLTNPTTKLDVSGIAQFTANAASLNLVGTDHTYIQWYPDGIAAGRKGYTGYPGSSVDNFSIFNEIAGGGLSFGVVGSEKAVITSAGYFKASDNGSYYSSTGAYHEYNQSTTGDHTRYYASNASYGGQILIATALRAANSAYRFVACQADSGSNLVFNLRGDGQAYADGSWNGGGADYAEYFEWEDGNPDDEDRRGYSVSLVNDKIKIAEEGEQIIGVISGNPSVVGDAAWNKWSGKYLTDDFGSYIFEEHNVVEWTDEDGKQHSYEDWNLPEDVVVPEDAVIKTHDEKGNRFTHRKLNPEYNSNQEYIPREERKEWDAVGMMGKLRLRKGQLTGPNWIKLKDISATVEEWLVR